MHKYKLTMECLNLQYLQDLKQKRAKIIISDVNDQVARQVMCEAYRLQMTAVQVFVLNNIVLKFH